MFFEVYGFHSSLGTIPSKSVSKLAMVSMFFMFMRAIEVQSVKLSPRSAYREKSFHAFSKAVVFTLRTTMKGAVNSPWIIFPRVRAVSGLFVWNSAVVTASSKM